MSPFESPFDQWAALQMMADRITSREVALMRGAWFAALASEARAAPHPPWCSCGACNPEDAPAAREQEGNVWRPEHFEGVEERAKELHAWMNGEASATGAEPTYVRWTDKWDCKHVLSLASAAKMLREYYDEWPGGLEEIESALRTAATPTSAPVQAVPPEPDPLQGAADWLKEALNECAIVDLQCNLSIGYNRAKRLFEAASPPAQAEGPTPMSEAEIEDAAHALGVKFGLWGQT